MREILPDIYTWSWFSQPHGYDFNGYLVRHREGNLCIDPVQPGDDLAEIELHGVKVDQCAHCGGVFLDAGELEQLEKHGEGVLNRVFSMFR